jgi:CheY-like chemotaxis protein
MVDAGVWALVVEDDVQTRSAMADALEEAGYLVAEAADGLVGLEVMRASPYPLIVVLDYWMPRVDGARVLRTMAAEPALRRHACILVTATPELLPPFVADLLGQMDVPVIAKPFDTDELLEATARAARRLYLG